MMNRRTFMQLTLSAGLSCCPSMSRARADATAPITLATAPIELAGDWDPSYPPAALKVLERIRKVCLANVRLVSDRQPKKIRVDEHPQGTPAIWLHSEEEDVAWIIVNIGPHDWCKLAYQFGHELGHVLCNSWQVSARPGPPSQWVEEALVEAFSLRGLNYLAESWAADPPFAGNASYAGAIREYRQNLVNNYSRSAQENQMDLNAWLKEDRSFVMRKEPKARLIIEILSILERYPQSVVDLGAVNRWRSRTYVPIEDYVTLWEKSCREVKSPGMLPSALARLFGVG